MNGFNKKGSAAMKQESRRQQMYQDAQIRARQQEREEAVAKEKELEKKNEEKVGEAVVAEKQKLSMKRGSSRTIATSPQGVLGAAPINKPGLSGTLGTRY